MTGESIPLHVVERLPRRAQEAHVVDVTAVRVRAQVERRELRSVRYHARVEGLLREEEVARIVAPCATKPAAREMAVPGVLSRAPAARGRGDAAAGMVLDVGFQNKITVQQIFR